MMKWDVVVSGVWKGEEGSVLAGVVRVFEGGSTGPLDVNIEVPFQKNPGQCQVLQLNNYIGPFKF